MASPQSGHLSTVSASLCVSSVDSAAWDSTDDLVGIRDSAMGPDGAGAGIRGSSVSRPVRALISLLQLAGLSGGRGWRPMLYAGLLFVVASAVSGFIAVQDFWHGQALLTTGVHWIRVFVLTNYFGLAYLIPWLALTATFVRGRRCYAALLSRLLQLLQDMTEFAEFRDKNEAMSQPKVWHLWMIVILLPLVTLLANWSGIADSIDCNTNNMLTSECVLSIVLIVLVTVVDFFFQLIVVQFLLAASLLETCQRALNSALAAAVSGRDGADSARRLRRAARLLRRLSDCLSQLTSVAAAGLIPSMLYGVLTQILLMVALLDMLLQMGGLVGVVVVVSYFCSALVALVGPCEANERLVAGLSRCRDLLLRLEDTRPELAPRAERLQREVTRDLDSTGDLGLYRLRRSTLLGIWSAVITYIIVMLQFLDSKNLLGEAGALADWENITMSEYE